MLENFDRDRTSQRGVFGPQDDSVASASQDPQDFIRAQPSDRPDLLRDRKLTDVKIFVGIVRRRELIAFGRISGGAVDGNQPSGIRRFGAPRARRFGGSTAFGTGRQVASNPVAGLGQGAPLRELKKLLFGGGAPCPRPA